MAEVKLPAWLKEARDAPCLADGKDSAPGFLEKNLEGIASFFGKMVYFEGYASKKGLLQAVEPRARILGVLALVLACVAASGVVALSGVFLVTLAIALLSKVGLSALIKRVLPSFLFTSVLLLPVFFSFVTPGEPIAGFMGIYVTRQGAGTAFFFISRVSLMASLVMLLLLTTRQTDFFRGLRQFLPAFFVTTLFMTFRYIFVLLKVAEDSTLARKSRTFAKGSLRESQDWFASRIALILKKSLSTAEEVSMAMASRGFNGKLDAIGPARMGKKDLLWVGLAWFVFFLSLGL
ncbi:MAG: cobalt ECF transporter T component CbiQ [Deltaproteobacteria bacterium]|nr:cobalt ECF transporter T component CbiQ [Deltaproteobacteria bacterium]